ncbi:MAG: hypothetical protein IPO83_14105 [Chitinophagaceae bacterium]|nr:hypothetical protein [Chitinophagaceae bacterium]
MKPTNKFNETVNTAAPEKKSSSQPNGQQEQPPIVGSLENIEVVKGLINHHIEWAYNDTDPNKNS